MDIPKKDDYEKIAEKIWKEYHKNIKEHKLDDIKGDVWHTETIGYMYDAFFQGFFSCIHYLQKLNSDSVEEIFGSISEYQFNDSHLRDLWKINARENIIKAIELGVSFTREWKGRVRCYDSKMGYGEFIDLSKREYDIYLKINKLTKDELIEKLDFELNS